MGGDKVRVEVGKPLSWIVFSVPDKLNAMSSDLLVEATNALRRLEQEEGVWFVAFTGEGRAFSAGIDLSEVASAGSPEERESVFARLAEFFDSLLSTRLVTIAAVNGIAAGGGAEMLWAVDLSVAVRNARIIWPEARWGLVAPALSTLGPWMLGPGLAGRLALEGGELSGEEAYRLGLVSLVVDSPGELRRAVEALVERVMANSPEAVDTTARLLKESKRSLLLSIGVKELLRLARGEKLARAAESFVKTRRPPDYRDEWLSGGTLS